MDVDEDLKPAGNVSIYDLGVKPINPKWTFPSFINWMSPFPILGLLEGIFHLYSNFKRNLWKQTVENLIRRRDLRRLIRFCTICRCPTKRMLGLYGLPKIPKSHGYIIALKIINRSGRFGSALFSQRGIEFFDLITSHQQSFKLFM